MVEEKIVTNLPLFQAGSVEGSVATKWTTLIKLKINPDEEVFVNTVYIYIWNTGDGQVIKISSNNMVLEEYEPLEGFICMMFFNNELRFTKEDKEALVIEFKTDGVNDFDGEAQIIGVRRLLKK